ncbi:uncharacterized protein A4U43_C08F12610 [Asparagus officinalis]|nr:uncharacterized protein A4U43_C08F12610 [Asparagus officinalis]
MRQKTPRTVRINDPKLQEFLQVMQPRAKSKIWADDTLRTAQLDKGGKANEEGCLSKRGSSLAPSLRGGAVTGRVGGVLDQKGSTTSETYGEKDLLLKYGSKFFNLS